MNKSIYLVLITIVTIGCATKEQTPILTLTKDVADFGKINYDSIIKIHFEYENTGSGNLKIINATADCGCTTVNYNKNNLAPGKKDFIEVTYEPKSNSDSGLIVKNVSLLTNSSTSPITIIKIKGFVKKY